MVAGGDGNLYMLRDTTNWADGGTNVEVNIVERTNNFFSPGYYVGGNFESVTNDLANRVPFTVNNIAFWSENTNQWQALGRGVNGTVYTIADIFGVVYVGGSFTQATNADGTVVAARNMARWNGTSWSALGGGVDGIVRKIIPTFGGVYVGGNFTTVNNGTVTARYIAAFDTSTNQWSAVSPGSNAPDAEVRVIDRTGDYVYVGTGCRLVELRPSTGVWRTLLQFTPVGGCEDTVRTFLSNIDPPGQGWFWLGGDFQQAGGVTYNNILLYNVATNTPFRVGTGVNGPVNSMQFGHDSVDFDNWQRVNLAGTFTLGGSEGLASASVRHSNLSDTRINSISNWDFVPDASTSADRPLRSMSWDLGFNRHYIAGQFTNLRGVQANSVALVNLDNGNIETALNGGVWRRPNHFYRYDPSTDTWTALVPYGNAAALVSDGGQFIYATTLNLTDFARYDVNAGTWAMQAALPAAAGAGSTMAFVGGSIYAVRGTGNDFYRYTPGTNSWASRTNLPFSVGAGASLVWDGGDYLYLSGGGNERSFARYHRTNDAWETLPEMGTPGTSAFRVNSGSGMARIGQHIYANAGGLNNASFYRYGLVNPPPTNKLFLDDVAFIAPANAASATWLNPDLGTPGDFRVRDDGGNQWVKATDGAWPPGWSPAPWIIPLDRTAARLRDPARNVYRTQPGSTLTAGYFTPHPHAEVFVSPTYCAGCDNDGLGASSWNSTAFASIQAAINSGTEKVVLRAGRYAEPFYLVSGVEVIGTGADNTLIEAPLGTTPAALVTAEGVVGARLSRVTLAGAGSGTGLQVDGQAQDVRFARSIVRNTGVAIQVDGSQTDAEVVNTTLAYNTTGLQATACAGVEVRNTVFAFHTDTALSYQACASSKRHRYNAYWRNGRDRATGSPNPAPAKANSTRTRTSSARWRTTSARVRTRPC